MNGGISARFSQTFFTLTLETVRATIFEMFSRRIGDKKGKVASDFLIKKQSRVVGWEFGKANLKGKL